MSKVFYCYSPNLQKELKDIGEECVARVKHPETQRNCWLFLYTDELIEYLNNRPKIKHKYIKNTKNPKFS